MIDDSLSLTCVVRYSALSIYGEHHGDIAASFNNLGIVDGNLGQYSKAKEY